MLHFGIRDQNLELKIGISDEKIYLVTTLIYVFWCIVFHAVAFFYFALQLADVFMLFPVDRCIYLFAALANVFNVVSGQLISLFISG